MKDYLVNNDPDFVLGYEVDGKNINIMLGDKSRTSISYSDDNINYLDRLMEEQHKNYKYNPAISLDRKNIITSAVVGGTFGTAVAISESDNTSNMFFLSSLIGIGTFFVSSYVLGAMKAETSYKDYEKDELLLNYKEQLEGKFQDVSFYNSLSSDLREKVIDIYIGNDHLCLNAINNFSLKDMENLIWKSLEYDTKNKKLSRK